MPSFVEAFDAYLDQHDQTPDQQAFVQAYMEANHHVLEGLSEAQAAAVHARAARAYPSLIRKLHFRALAQESGLFESVAYDAQQHSSAGVDAIVTYQGQRFAVRCTTPSRGSRRRKRRIELPADTGLLPIIVTFDRKQAQEVGQFYLFTPEDVLRLRDECQRCLAQAGADSPDGALEHPTAQADPPTPRPSQPHRRDVRAAEGRSRPDTAHADEERRGDSAHPDEVEEVEHGQMVDWDADHPPPGDVDYVSMPSDADHAPPDDADRVSTSGDADRAPTGDADRVSMPSDADHAPPDDADRVSTSGDTDRAPTGDADRVPTSGDAKHPRAENQRANDHALGNRTGILTRIRRLLGGQ